MKSKNVYIIAGPNGSGKTTFADKFLPDYVDCPNFVNADIIAKKLAPSNPHNVAIKAGRLVLQQLDEYARQGVDFGFETTLAGRSYVDRLRSLKSKGYGLYLYFLWVPSSELSIARIKGRVAEGGHNIPVEDVRRRFTRSIYNFFNLYCPLLDSWILFDNSKMKPVVIAKGKNENIEVFNKELFEIIKKTVR